MFTFSSLAWVQKRKHSVANNVDVRVCGRSLLFTRPARVAPMARVRWVYQGVAFHRTNLYLFQHNNTAEMETLCISINVFILKSFPAEQQSSRVIG